MLTLCLSSSSAATEWGLVTNTLYNGLVIGFYSSNQLDWWVSLIGLPSVCLCQNSQGVTTVSCLCSPFLELLVIMIFFYIVLDKVVLFIANRVWPLLPLQGLVFQGRWSVTLRVDEGELSSCVICAWGFFLHSFIVPQLRNTTSEKKPAKATHGVDCRSTDWGVCTRRVVWS